MKDQILELIESNPKHYTRMILKNPAYLAWINANSKIDSDDLIANLRSALYNETNVCQYGNTKTIRRLADGFRRCGPANACQCTKEAISSSVSTVKQTYSAKQKAEINSKRTKTMLNKYGVKYNSQRSDVKQKLSKPKIAAITYEKLTNKEWLYNEYVVNGQSASSIARKLGVYYGTVLDYCRQHGFDIKSHSNYSDVELQVAEFLTSHDIVFDVNNRSLLNGKELDIYIPAHNIAIEVNGLYWHSYNPTSAKDEDRFAHLKKSKACAEQNITLIHITDYQWHNQNDICSSIILSKLGINQKVHARKCTISEVSTTAEKDFLTQQHLQGWTPSSKKLGLFFCDELIGLATFKRARFNNYATELLRLCFKHGITVVGGVSKLMHASGYNEIFTYTKNDIGFSDLTASGFRCIGYTGPGYFWTDGNNCFTRFQTQKSKLPKLLMHRYDPALSEAENMFNAGYRRYWDTGNTKWLWSRKQC